jgi:organic radical activating enzyme
MNACESIQAGNLTMTQQTLTSQSLAGRKSALPQADGFNLTMSEAQPDSITILPTYRCNAACPECCFESNPFVKHRMDLSSIVAFIDRIPIELPRVRYVVLSGGEVTLLRQDLVKVVEHLTRCGLGSRIVTNGHWGRTAESAEWWTSRLVQAGLGELNLSTGDEHQQFVPFESVARAAYSAVQAGLVTVLVVEGHDNSSFREADIRSHALIKEIMETPTWRDRFILMTNVWMPFHEATNVTNLNTKVRSEPCKNIFENFVLNPYGKLLSCCGLTMEYIPELTIGNIKDPSLGDVYRSQFQDLLKLWIWLDGTEFIFQQAVVSGELEIEMDSPHMCAICAQIHKDDRIRDVVAKLVIENKEQILFRSLVKARVNGRVPIKSTRKADGHA